ncbi:MAG: hypothetical protein K0R13_2215 [Propionibacteriaceae bacterium]|nr:hypothetical protein [Propionibacteriaceae bacterium]
MTACPLTRGRNSGRPSEGPQVGTGGTRGQRPPAPLSGFMREQRPENRGAAGLCRLRKQQGEGFAAPSTFRHGALVDPLGFVPRVVQVQALGPEPHCRQLNRQSSCLLRRRFQVGCPRAWWSLRKRLVEAEEVAWVDAALTRRRRL